MTGLLLSVPVAWAATYQWKDAQGHTVISDQPPPGNVRAVRTLGEIPSGTAAAGKPGASPNANAGAATGAAAATGTGTPAAAPARPSLAEQELDFRKRRQAAQEKESKEAADKAAAAERQENCTRARNQMTALQSGTPMFQFNSKGERTVMEDRQREQEMERARKAIAGFCN